MSDENKIADNLDPKTDAMIEDQVNTDTISRQVKKIDNSHVAINDVTYQIVEDYHEALDLEQLEERYTDFFEKFHYIVGDLSKDQVRLKGFYEDDQQKVPNDLKISQLEDYLTEYCSFNCPYFVLKRQAPIKSFEPYRDHYSDRNKKSKRQSSRRRNKQGSYNKQKRSKSSPKNKKRSNQGQFKKHDKQNKQQNKRSQNTNQQKQTVKDADGKAKFTINRKQS